jgi:hypothetical protein
MDTSNTGFLQVEVVTPCIDGFTIGFVDFKKLKYRMVRVLSKDDKYSGVYIVTSNAIQRKLIGRSRIEFVDKNDVLARLNDSIQTTKATNLDKKTINALYKGGHRGMPMIETLD